MHLYGLRPAFLVFTLLFALHSGAAEADVSKTTSAGTVDDPVTAMRRFRVAPGLKVDLFASEPMAQNIVSFAFDEQGRCYVVESFRRRTSVFDIRGLPDWLDNDFSFRTVEDRANFFRRTLTSTNPAWASLLESKRGLLSDFNRDGVVDWHDLEVESERIRMLVDTNADGRADVAATFAEGFDGITSGVAAGVLARKGDVWFTCIPDLWKISSAELRSTAGMPNLDAPANPHRERSKIQIQNLMSGFGVHIAFGGHDMHGLKMGPDGKIYFSIADRGTSTNLWDKVVDRWPGLTLEALADSGAVFRCNPDGSQFEVICIGLRNPQELAFDDLGNLFAGENNGDGGDKARWIHVVEGADYGWRMGWQWLPKMGAWNSELLWGMEHTNTSSYYLPPVAHIGAGPSGVAYYPGTGLPARYDRHFFMCDFRGGPNSVVRAFALRPQGASFEAYDESEFISGFLCTDVDFGTDGAVYVSDWVKGWEKTDKGRIYRVFDPELANDPTVRDVKRLLSDGMERHAPEVLGQFLGHRDMRVRLEAQWELMERSRTNQGARVLLERVSESGLGLAQIHALWALGQIVERGVTWSDHSAFNAALARLETARLSTNAQVRAQASRLLGRNTSSPQWQKEWSADNAVQVRFLSLQAMARIFPHVKPADQAAFREAALPGLIDALKSSRSDAYLRHAAVLALARIADVPALLAAAKDSSAAVRMGVCLALRRLERPEVAQFLTDTDPKIASEAARAIHDVPIASAARALADLRFQPQSAPSVVASAAHSAALWRRVLNVNFRLGGDSNAHNLAHFATSGAPETLRVEALELLAKWPKPPGRDHVVGLWRPLPAREAKPAANALASVLSQLEANAPTVVKIAAQKAVSELNPKPAQELATDRGTEGVGEDHSCAGAGDIAGKTESVCRPRDQGGCGFCEDPRRLVGTAGGGKHPERVAARCAGGGAKEPGGGELCCGQGGTRENRAKP